MFVPNNWKKIHPDFDLLLGEILRKNQNGICLLFEDKSHFITSAVKERIKRNIPNLYNQVIFLPRLNESNYYSVLSFVMLGCDSFFFCGGNTTYEALFFGLPIVTLETIAPKGRYTLAAYKQMGIYDCIANSYENYVEISLKIALEKIFLKAEK